MSKMTSGLKVSQMPGFVAGKKDYRMVKTRTGCRKILIGFFQNNDINNL